MNVTTGNKYPVNVYFIPAEGNLDVLPAEVAEYYQEDRGYKGKLSEAIVQVGPNTVNTLVIGLGDEAKLTRDRFVQAANKAAKLLEEHKIKQATFNVDPSEPVDAALALQGVVEGVLQATYVFEDYKSEKSTQALADVSFNSTLEDVEAVVQEMVTVIEGINLSRELTNTPANDLYPESFANKVEDVFKDSPVEIEVFDKAALEELGAHALLAVSKASEKEPRIIIVKYLPLGEDEPVISLVGKGVTYDSGGYAIKNARGMASMKTDMAGAASVIGTIKALADNNVQQNVIAIVGATENLISGDALKNGDIINSLKGTTIEVLNTDAEGRLVLADILYYAATKFNSKSMINVATLTGGVVAALGTNMTGAFTNNDALLKDVLAASETVGEDMWQLPITEEFRNKLKDGNADLVNHLINGSGASAITAAAFLEYFVEDTPWVHLDIAGTASAGAKGNKYLPKGASGIPVKTMYEYIKNTVK